MRCVTLRDKVFHLRRFSPCGRTRFYSKVVRFVLYSSKKNAPFFWIFRYFSFCLDRILSEYAKCFRFFGARKRPSFRITRDLFVFCCFLLFFVLIKEKTSILYSFLVDLCFLLDTQRSAAGKLYDVRLASAFSSRHGLSTRFFVFLLFSFVFQLTTLLFLWYNSREDLIFSKGNLIW